MKIAFDLETIADQDKINGLPELEIKYGNTKDHDKRAVIEHDAKQKQISKMALSPYTGKICAFATAGDVEKSDFVLVPSEEKTLIRELFNLLEDTSVVITFNGCSFDFPYLYTRAMLLGVPAPVVPLSYYAKRYSLQPHFDVRMALGNWDSHASGNLGYYGRQILGVDKEELEYSKFAEMIAAGRGAEIAENCMQHTKLTLELYKKIAPYYAVG